MKIYNEAQMITEYFDKFKDIINEIIEFSKNLNISELKEIKITEDNYFNASSDGKFENNIIYFPKSKIEQYIIQKNYDLLKSTVYHELCHADMQLKLPKLHLLKEKYMLEEDYIKVYTINSYIEYLVHKESSKLETDKNIIIFFESINNFNWDFSTEKSGIYFIKFSPYAVGRMHKNYEFINLISNIDIKNRILEMKTLLEAIPFSDEYNLLYDLEKYVSNYISND